MFKNYLIAAIRHIRQSKTYSFLNFFGLAVGVACAGLIFLWVEDEMNYDQHYANRETLAQVLTNQTYEGTTRTFRSTPGPLAPALKREVPGIANAARTAKDRLLFNIDEKSIYNLGLYVDSSFFSMFTPQFIQGNAENAFSGLHSIVITERMAEQLFGKGQEVVGQTIRVNNEQDFIITGVVANSPSNTTIEFDWLSPWANYEKKNDWLEYWQANSPFTYVQLSKRASLEEITDKIADFIHQKAPETETQLVMLGMKDWRLRSNFVDGKQSGGRIEFVRLFAIIAWIILIIACINFMNLSTARSAKRSREVGVRKVLGAGRKSLVLQFMGEAMIMAFISVILGIIFIQLALPFFNAMLGSELAIGLNQPGHWLAALAIALFCGIVAGSYPAFYLSSFNPIYVFKGLKLKTGGSAMIRRALVGFQFTISITLIICTILVYQQVKHVKNRDLGYDKSNLVEIPVTGNIKNNFSVLRQQLLATGIVENSAVCNTRPLQTANNTSGFEWESKAPDSKILISIRSISADYFETMGMQLKEGRKFNTDATTDSSNVIITESMARLLGEGSPIGKIIRNNGTETYTVVGVIKDYIYGNMYGQPDPVVFFSQPEEASFLYIRYKPGAEITAALTTTVDVVGRNNPGYPVEYHFVDDQFAALFKSETLIGNLSKIFAALALAISCLGLFGLSAFTAEQRTREIGIRKVLGANVTGLVAMLSKDFLRIVVVAILLATPLAFYCMQRWLQDFPYRISINWWVFVLGGLTAVFIALITVSFQAVKVARMNPARSLKSE